MAIVETDDPRIITSPEHLPEHQAIVRYHPDEPVYGDGVLDWLYTLLSQQHGELQVSVKVFEPQPHGREGVERTGTVSSLDLQKGLDRFARGVSQEEDKICIPAVSGVFTTVNGHKHFMPMLDLEKTASGATETALRNDLQIIGEALSQAGLTGSILRTGDVDRGSYHYVGDYALPYEPYYWQYMGLFMTSLVDNETVSIESAGNIANSLGYGSELVGADNLLKAQGVASEILDTFPSIKSGDRREGLFYDPRWVAHRLKQGINTLRLTVPTKGYKERPRLVAEVY